jgi:hypothetical protein
MEIQKGDARLEICVLAFSGAHAAEDALKDVLAKNGDKNPWLFDVGTIARPLIGRVRVGATFPDGKEAVLHEGDLGKVAGELGGYTGYYVSALAGPLGSMIGSLNAEMAAETWGTDEEQKLFHLDALKKLLARDSSALVLIAEKKRCDELVELFKPFRSSVLRRDAAAELGKLLRELHDRLAAGVQAGIEGAPPPSP